ncbi:MAG: hypothetical protein OQK70_07075, partial [Gammaproteobacteria bacterium]|nr:hypothetical protein [Gammaproteobacteria bacterium]
MSSREQQNSQSDACWPSDQRLMDDQQNNELYQRCLPLVQVVLEQEKLNTDLLALLKTVYLPLAAWIAGRHQNKPVVIGINGAQGSGKSTLSKILKPVLSEVFNKTVVELSIDDFYLSRNKRKQLADTVHSLLQVRGVPGTHDVELAKQIISKLTNTDFNEDISIPVFDKAMDDLLPEDQWRSVEQPVDIILFEGWCVDACAQDEIKLEQAINELELKEDADAVWRRYVNQQLAGSYKTLFEKIDYLIMLKVPDMASVYEWRNLQEQK